MNNILKLRPFPTARLRLEQLEDRRLLSVTAAEYDAIRTLYAEFDLSATMSDVNIIEIETANLTLAQLKAAITEAGTTAEDDLIVVRTTDAANGLVYTDATDEITIGIDSFLYGKLSLVGFGTDPLTIDAANLCRVFKLSAGTLQLGNLTIAGGNVVSDTGGGIYAATGTTLTMIDCTISDCSATSTGGGIYSAGDASILNCVISGNSTQYDGGGIYNVGSMSVERCFFENNSATTANYSHGGGLFSNGTLTVIDSVFIKNYAAWQGGGIENFGTMTVIGCTVAGNSAGTDVLSYGGGVSTWYGTVSIFNTIISGNFCGNARDYSGEVFSGSNNLLGYAAGFVEAPVFDADGVLLNADSMDLHLTAESWAVDFGASAMAAADVDFDGNTRIVGAAVDVGAYEYQSVVAAHDAVSTVVDTLDDSFDPYDGETSLREVIFCAPSGEDDFTAITFDAALSGSLLLDSVLSILVNCSIDGDGRITLDGQNKTGIIAHCSDLTLKNLTLTHGYAGNGAAVASAQLLIIDRCSLIDNEAVNRGGAIHCSGGTVQMTNSLVAGNTSGLYGGGIYLFTLAPPGNPSGTLTLTQTTVAGNTSADGGGLFNEKCSVTLENSIVAENVGGNQIQTSSPVATIGVNTLTDFTAWSSGSVNNVVYNAASPLFVDSANGDYRLADDSQAVGVGDNAYLYEDDDPSATLLISTDLAGNPRILNGTVDLGANEYVPEGYNANDYIKLLTFLNLSSATEGVTNGAALNAAYDPYDPTTWTGVTWEEIDGEKRVAVISWYDKNIAGALDVSGFTALVTLNCSNNSLTALDISTNAALTDLYCHDNNLTTLDVSSNAALTALYCHNNNLTALDVSVCTALRIFLCYSNSLTTLDVSNNTALENLSCWNENLATVVLSDEQIKKTAINLSNGSDSGWNWKDGAGDPLATVNTGSSYTPTQLALTATNAALTQTITFLQTWTVGFFQTWTVDSAADGAVDLTDDTITLREAMFLASAGDTIVFDASLNGRTITLAGTELATEESLTIDASALAGGITIDGNGLSRVLNISGGTEAHPFSLVNITITGGYSTGYMSGGGVCSETGTVLTMIDCTVSDCYAGGGGGGISSYGVTSLLDCVISGNSTASSGGGIICTGTMTVERCLIENNEAIVASKGNGGGIDSRCTSLIVIDSVFTKNRSAWHGAAIDHIGGLTVTGCTIAGNSAGNGIMPLGGGIGSWSSTVSVSNTIISNNFCGIGQDFGGDSFSGSNNLIGCDAGFVEAPVFDANGVLLNADTLDLHLTANSWAVDSGDSALTAATVDFDDAARFVGAAVDIGAYEYQSVISERDVISTVVDTLDDRVDPYDGKTSLREAIFGAADGEDDFTAITFDASLSGSVLLDSVLSILANCSIDGDGRITLDGQNKTGIIELCANVTLKNLTFTHGYANSGAAIAGNQLLTIDHCNFIDNEAFYYGGAIYYGVGAIQITNSLIAGNTSGLYGGGIFETMGTLTITQTTVAGNTSASGGGLYLEQSTVTLENSIIAENTGGNQIQTSYPVATIGVNTLTDFTAWSSGSANNIVYDAESPLFVDSTNGDYRLADGSQAIDVGDDALAAAAGLSVWTEDLGGIVRVLGIAVDLGAYEYSRQAAAGGGVVGLRVVATDPVSTQSVLLDKITFYFNKRLADGWVSSDAILAFSDAGGNSLLSTILSVTTETYGDYYALVIAIEPPGVSGNYTIALSSEICDADGWSVDQDYNGVRNETADRFILSFDLAHIDLAIADVEIAPSAAAGEIVEVNWTVTNLGADSTVGVWYDSVYLSTDDVWSLDDSLLGRYCFDSSERSSLAQNAGYSGSLSAVLPGTPPGDYYVLVRTDETNALLELDETNNVACSGAFSIFFNELGDGETRIGTTTGQERNYYQFVVSESYQSANVFLSFATENTDVYNEIYFSYDSIPSESAYDVRSLAGSGATAQIALNGVAPGVYYVLTVSGVRSASSESLGAYSLTCEVQERRLFTVLNANFGKGGMAGDRTIEINGVGFDRSTAVVLTDALGNVVAEPESYDRVGSETIYATFDLTRVAVGVYDVRMSNDTGSVVTIAQSFEVTDAAGASGLSAGFVNKSSYSSGTEVLQFSFTWSNSSLNDIYAPQITIYCSEFFAESMADALAGRGRGTYTFTPSGALSSSDVLLVGDSGSLTFYALLSSGAAQVWYRTETIENIWYERERELKASEVNIWESAGALLDSDGLSEVEFLIQYDIFAAEAGRTNEGYLQLLKKTRSLFSDLPTDVVELERLLFQEAFDRFLAANAAGVFGSIGYSSCDVALDSLVVAATRQTETTTEIRYANVRLDGSFVFVGMAPGEYALTLSGGLVLAAPETISLAANRPLALALDAVPPARLSGTVFNTDVDALSGALVRAENIATGQVYQSVTQRGGAFAFVDMMPGEYRVTIRLSEYVRQETLISLSDGETESRDFYLVASGIVQGQVTDSDGAPLSDVTVTAVSAEGIVLCAETDASGVYRMSGLSAGEWTFGAAFADYIDSANVTRSIDPAVPETLDIQLVRGGVLSGAVTNSLGVGISGATVSFTRGGMTKTVLTDGAGVWRLTGLGTGDFLLSINAADYTPMSVSVTDLARAEERDLGRIVFERGITLGGTVWDAESNRPVANAAVYIESKSAGFAATVRTGGDGTFLFTNLPEGLYSCRIEAEYYATATRSIELSADTQDVFLLTREYMLSGNLTDAAGNVITDDEIAVALYGSDRSFIGMVRTTDGIYQFAGLESGDYFVLPTASTRLFDSRRVTLDGDAAGVDSFDFAALSGSIIGTVRRAEEPNEPVAGARVTLSTQDTLTGIWKSLTAETDALGEYAFGAAPAGAVILTAEKTAMAAQTVNLTSILGENFTQNFTLAGSCRLDGVVRSVTGEGIAGATVVLISVDDEGNRSYLTATADEDGRYLFTEAPIAEVTLEVYADGFYLARETVELTGSGDEFDIGLQNGLCSLSGEFDDCDFGLVYLIQDGLIAQFTTLDTRGRFVMSGIASGAYMLVLIDETSRREWSVEVTGDTIFTALESDAAFSFFETSLLPGVASPMTDIASLPIAVKTGESTQDWGVLLARYNVQLDQVLIGQSQIEALRLLRTEVYDSCSASLRVFNTLYNLELSTPADPVYYASAETFNELLAEYGALWTESQTLAARQALLLSGKYQFLTPANTTTYYLAAAESAVSQIRGLSVEVQKLFDEQNGRDENSAVLVASLNAIDKKIEQLQENADSAETDIETMAAVAKRMNEQAIDWSAVLTVYNARLESYLADLKAYHAFEAKMSAGEIITLVSLNGDSVKGFIPATAENAYAQIEGDNAQVDSNLRFVIDPPDTLCAENAYRYSVYCDNVTVGTETRTLLCSHGIVNVIVIDSDVSLTDLAGDPSDVGKELISRCEALSIPPSILWEEATRITVSTNTGFGERDWITPCTLLEYIVHFESEGIASTTPIQKLVVEQRLDANFDFSTFQFGALEFGAITVDCTQKTNLWRQRLDLLAIYGVYVDLEARFDPSSGVMSCTLTAVDPVTGQVADFTRGFMIPQGGTTEKSGFLSYTVRFREDADSGAVIEPAVFVQFNDYAIISATGDKITVDTAPPTTAVEPLSVLSASDFRVEWSGTDSESGVAAYDIYYSVNGGAYSLWQQNTKETSAVFHGTSGATYYFYSLGIDNTGNRQTVPARYISTTVSSQYLTVTPTVGLVTWSNGSQASFSVKLSVRPTSDVRVTIVSSAENAGDPLVAELIFTPANWNVAQVVTVRGRSEIGDYSVDLNCVSEDARFLDQRTVSVQLTNRDVSALRPTVLDISLTEGAGGMGIAITFSRTMDFDAVLNDASILRAVSVVSHSTGESISLSIGQFSWNLAQNRLKIALGSELISGTYGIELDGTVLKSADGYELLGSTGSNLILTQPEYGAALILASNTELLKTDDYSVPTLFDYDADGLLDLVVGEKGADGFGRVRLYLNLGSDSSPVYGDYSYLRAAGETIVVASDGCLGAYPRFADLDDDGLVDLLLGLSDGSVLWYRNTAAEGLPLFTAGVYLTTTDLERNETRIDVGGRAAFDVVDWNNDDKLDLVVGALDGTISVFLNVSETGANGVLFAEGMKLLLDGGELAVTDGRASVSVVDFDSDGRKDLICGNTSGKIWYFRNIGSDTAPLFGAGTDLLIGDNPVAPSASDRSRPYVVDYNADGILDLLVGDASGLVRVYLGQANTTPARMVYQTDSTRVDYLLSVSIPEVSLCVQEGGQVYIDASSLFKDASDVVYEWDLDGDGVFGDTTGLRFWLPSKYEPAFVSCSQAIYVRTVSADNAVSAPRIVLVNLLAVAPSVSVCTNARADGRILLLALDVLSCGDRVVSNWFIDWGDGITETFDTLSNVLKTAHYYAPRSGDSTYTVTLETIDSDGYRASYVLARHTVLGTVVSLPSDGVAADEENLKELEKEKVEMSPTRTAASETFAERFDDALKADIGESKLNAAANAAEMVYSVERPESALLPVRTATSSTPTENGPLVYRAEPLPVSDLPLDAVETGLFDSLDLDFVNAETLDDYQDDLTEIETSIFEEDEIRVSL